MEITRDIFIDLKAWKDCKRRKPWIVISVLQQRFGDFPTFLGKRFGDFRFYIIPVKSKRFNGDILVDERLSFWKMFLGQDDRAELVHLFVKRFLLAFVKTGILAAMFQMKRLKAMSEKNNSILHKCSACWTVLFQKCSAYWTFITIKCIVHWTLFCNFADERL